MSEHPGGVDSSYTPKGAPAGYFVVVAPEPRQDSIDVSALLESVWAAWWKLAIAALVGAIAAAIISLQLPEKFLAQALISPVRQGENGAAGALRNQFSGVAALAGIDLGSNAGRGEESLATFDSSGFAREFITSQNLLPVLFAERWDAAAGKWKAGEKPPTLEAAVVKFTGDVRTISEDRKTGLVTVSVTWYSPELAATWANRMVEQVNERLRSEATRNAERSIAYLNQELAKTSVVDIRQGIYRLIQDQVSNAMMANVQREYGFRFIDPAVAPETRSSPKRTLIVLAGAFIGLLVGLLVVLLRHWLRSRRHASPAMRTS